MDRHMKYTQPTEFILFGKQIFVYKDLTSYVAHYKYDYTDAIRIVKLPSPRGAFIVYGDKGDLFSLALGGVFFVHSSYYAAPIYILVEDRDK